MAIILDIKNAVRTEIYNIDPTINFNFNEMPVAQYPYVFFSVPSFKLERPIDTQYRNLHLSCVIEYAKSENNSEDDLWDYNEKLLNALTSFSIYDIQISAKNIEFKTVDKVLRITFDLDFYLKEIDETDFMEEIDLTIKGGD